MSTFGKSSELDNNRMSGGCGGENQTKTRNGVSGDDGGECMKLPQTFVVKYLGREEASGLWGIKNTRKPVDQMVELAKKAKVCT